MAPTKPIVSVVEGLASPFPPIGEWPPYIPTAPATSYEGRRAIVEAQWHDSEAVDPENMRHIHLRAAVPTYLDTGIMPLDIFNTNFHFYDGVFQGVRGITHRTNTPVPKWMPTYEEGRDPGRRTVVIPNDPSGHLMTWWTPAFLDVRSVVVPDKYTFEIDSQTRRPDGRVANVRMIWRTLVDNEGTNQAIGESRKLDFEGWVSPASGEQNQFGYLAISVMKARLYESDPIIPMNIGLQAKVGRNVRFMICKNPNLHAHPANYGEIVYDTTFVSEKDNPTLTVTPPPMVAGDKLMFRLVDANDPDIGSGATLGVITLAEG